MRHGLQLELPRLGRQSHLTLPLRQLLRVLSEVAGQRVALALAREQMPFARSPLLNLAVQHHHLRPIRRALLLDCAQAHRQLVGACHGGRRALVGLVTLRVERGDFVPQRR